MSLPRRFSAGPAHRRFASFTCLLGGVGTLPQHTKECQLHCGNE
jgi:hypothetical protein